MRCLVKSSRASGGCAMHVGGVHVVEMSVNLRKIETGSLSDDNDLVLYTRLRLITSSV